MKPLEIGQVFWLEDCPPLDGQAVKRRPVIVIDADADPVIVVATTTTDCDDYDRIDLPNARDEPGTASGLPEPCCALPRWVLAVSAKKLRHPAGRLPKVTIDRLVEAIELRLDDPDTDGVIGLDRET